MEYLILFLEGMLTFLSPCLLPMLPVYISYFAGQHPQHSRKASLTNALGFVLGFTVVFILLGAFAGTLGSLLTRYRSVVNFVLGGIMILLGLNFIGVIHIPFINTTRQFQTRKSNLGFFSSIAFGIVFSVGWTPCVGSFLGSALMLAASGGESLRGIMMLLSFSAGLGIPFILSAVLIDRLKTSFEFIKRNYRIINMISGIMLIVFGVFMASGLMNYFLSLLTS